MIPTRARAGSSPSRRCAEFRFVSRLGPKDIEAGKCVVVRRDTREKIDGRTGEIWSRRLPEILETIQKDMFERAKAHRDAHTYDAHNYEEIEGHRRQTNRALSSAMWCGGSGVRGQDQRRAWRDIPLYPVHDQEQLVRYLRMLRQTGARRWFTGARHIKDEVRG